MSIRKRNRIAVMLASCTLIAASTAQASLQGDGRNYTPAPIGHGDDHARTGAAIAAPPAIAQGDDHARFDGVASPPAIGQGDDHARFDGVASSPAISSQPAVAKSSGFDWEDAGVGFGTAAGLALLAGGTLLGTRKMRQQGTLSV